MPTAARTYKIRNFVNGRNKAGDPFTNYSITIPAQLAEMIPEDMTFSVELNDEGILFRPNSPDKEKTDKVPDWTRKRRNGATKD